LTGGRKDADVDPDRLEINELKIDAGNERYNYRDESFRLLGIHNDNSISSAMI